jgi:hypothetical protein
VLFKEPLEVLLVTEGLSASQVEKAAEIISILLDELKPGDVQRHFGSLLKKMLTLLNEFSEGRDFS